jgi:hypothetical protein
MEITIDISTSAINEANLRAGGIPAGAEIIGTVARENELGRGALVRLPNSNYIEVNAGSLRTLQQSAVRRQIALAVSPSPAAAALGRLGGAATAGISTPAKTRAARANGKRGGRPTVGETAIRAAIQAEGLRPVRHGRKAGMNITSALRPDDTAAFWIHAAGPGTLAVDASMPICDRAIAARVAKTLNLDLLD